MWYDDGAETADGRDASVINGIFTAGMMLQSEVAHIQSSEAARHVERAIEQLDEALKEIRRVAFARRLDTEA